MWFLEVTGGMDLRQTAGGRLSSTGNSVLILQRHKCTLVTGMGSLLLEGY